MNEPDTEVAKVCAAVVFARPGTDSITVHGSFTRSDHCDRDFNKIS